MTTTPRSMQKPTRAAETAAAGPFADDTLTETEKFILETLERLDAADAKAEHLQLALNHSRDIGAAVGVLMSQHKLQQTEAFELLRQTSQAQNRKLYELAMEVVNTGELPSP